MSEKVFYPPPEDRVEVRKILADEAKAVIYDEDEIIKEFRYYRLIKSIIHCDVEVYSQKVSVLKQAWNVVIVLKVFIKYIDITGKKGEIVKNIVLNKEIPFPGEKHCDHKKDCKHKEDCKYKEDYEPEEDYERKKVQDENKYCDQKDECCHKYHVDYSCLPVNLTVLDAQCVEVSFKKCDYFTVVNMVVKVKLRLVATQKELLKVLTAKRKK